MRRTRRYWIWFATGVCAALVPPFVVRRSVSLEYALVVGTVVLVFAALPSIVARGKTEAVTSQKSDLIGYAVILVVVLAVAGIGYAVMK